MGKFTLFNEKGNIGAGATLLIIGAVGLLMSVLLVGIMEESLVGSRTTNEYLGNMTANVTTFTTNNIYSTESTYITFAVSNNTNISGAGGITAISAVCPSPCYNASSETNTIVVDMSLVPDGGFVATQAVWVNYTSSELGSLALASGKTISNSVGTALTLISVGLIVLGAGLILSYLTNWRR